MSSLTPANRGREHLYNLYNNPAKRSKLNDAIKHYRENISKIAEQELHINSQSVAYKYSTHEFYGGEGTTDFEKFLEAGRYHFEYSVKTFGDDLFPDDDKASAEVADYLFKKCFKNADFEVKDFFTKKGEMYSKYDRKIQKFFKEIEENQFKSPQEKLEEKAYRDSDAYKIKGLEDDIKGLEKTLNDQKSKISDSTQFVDDITAILKEAKEFGNKKISREGEANKEKLIKVYTELKELCEKGKDLSDYDINKIEDKFVNVAEKSKNFKAETLGNYLVKLNAVKETKAKISAKQKEINKLKGTETEEKPNAYEEVVYTIDPATEKNSWEKLLEDAEPIPDAFNFFDETEEPKEALETGGTSQTQTTAPKEEEELSLWQKAQQEPFELPDMPGAEEYFKSVLESQPKEALGTGGTSQTQTTSPTEEEEEVSIWQQALKDAQNLPDIDDILNDFGTFESEETKEPQVTEPSEPSETLEPQVTETATPPPQTQTTSTPPPETEEFPPLTKPTAKPPKSKVTEVPVTPQPKAPKKPSQTAKPVTEIPTTKAPEVKKATTPTKVSEDKVKTKTKITKQPAPKRNFFVRGWFAFRNWFVNFWKNYFGRKS